MTTVMVWALRSTRTPRRWVTGWALAAALLLGGLAPAAHARPTVSSGAASGARATAPSPDIEAQFVGRINSLRASKGLSHLQVHGEVQGVARNWTEKMVQAGQISHNPNLGSEVSGNWTKLGENVGVGYDVDGLMKAFINSPSHYKNLVDPDWNYVGVGVTMGPDGRMWTTHNFMAMPAAAPPPPPPAPKPAPAPRSQVAVAPPTTTTTVAPPPPPAPEPTPERVTAVLDPLRMLERG